MFSKKNMHPTDTLAIVLAVSANFFLGVSSLYWRSLNDVSPTTLVAYRIVLSAVTLTFFLLVFRRKYPLTQLTLKQAGLHCGASIIIVINWGSFIHASINGYLLESGLGYLLAPFISIVLGALIYHERVSTKKLILILAAMMAVVVLISISTLSHWTYLLIASTWGSYTYLKKSTSLDAVSGLFIETLFLMVLLALAIGLLNFPTSWRGEISSYSNPMVWFAGAVSIVPLLMFSFTTGKLPLSLTGFLQFILPLTLLSIGLFLHDTSTSHETLLSVITITTLLFSFLAYDLASSRTRQIKETRK